MSARHVFSLQKRLRWGLMGVLALLFVALWGAATYTIHRLVEHYLVTRLDHDADMLIRHLHWRAGHWQLDWSAVNPIYLRPNTGHYFVIELPRRRIDSPSLAGYRLWTPERPSDNPYETLAPAMTPDTGLETVLVWVRHAKVAGRPVRIFVAENHMPIRRYLYWFDGLFALIALLVLGLVGWWSRRMLDQGFASLNALRQAVDRAVRTGAPLRPPSVLPEEVAPLAETLEVALDQMQKRLQRYRHANADLAHSLKTPLHAMFQLLDDAQMDACPQARRALRQQAEQLRRRVEQTLAQARVAGDTLALTHFDLAHDLPQLLETLRTLYPSCRFQVQVPDWGRLPLEREDGYELLGNLLDNACKWAHGQVMLTIEQLEEAWRIQIDDDGPGVPPEQLSRLGQRGVRLDERGSENGIGLAIVAEIVHQYGGRLRFEQSVAGGLGVSIHLPTDAR